MWLNFQRISVFLFLFIQTLSFANETVTLYKKDAPVRSYRELILKYSTKQQYETSIDLVVGNSTYTVNGHIANGGRNAIFSLEDGRVLRVPLLPEAFQWDEIRKYKRYHSELSDLGVPVPTLYPAESVENAALVLDRIHFDYRLDDVFDDDFLSTGSTRLTRDEWKKILLALVDFGKVTQGIYWIKDLSFDQMVIENGKIILLDFDELQLLDPLIISEKGKDKTAKEYIERQTIFSFFVNDHSSAPLKGIWGLLANTIRIERVCKEVTQEQCEGIRKKFDVDTAVEGILSLISFVAD